MRRSPTGLNWLGVPLGISKIGYIENMEIWVIKGAEKDGVHAISRNFVFFELHGITGFEVNFQNCDRDIATPLIRRVLTS